MGEGVVEIKKREVENGVSVTAGTVAEIIAGEIVVRPIMEAEKDTWYAEHVDPEWKHGGQPDFEIITAHRDGFWFTNPGQITVVGTGFNQLRQVRVDGELVPLVPVSDTTIRVPWQLLTQLSEDSVVEIDLGDRVVSPNEVFFGDRQTVLDNLLF